MEFAICSRALHLFSLAHPVQCCFVGLIGVATINVAMGILSSRGDREGRDGRGAKINISGKMVPQSTFATSDVAAYSREARQICADFTVAKKRALHGRTGIIQFLVPNKNCNWRTTWSNFLGAPSIRDHGANHLQYPLRVLDFRGHLVDRYL